jgi:GT2 family glycosyltransferase
VSIDADATEVTLSVLMTCLNAADEIAGQLEALAAQESSEPWELVVADGGSTDATLGIVEQYRSRFPALRIVSAADRPGIAHGLNVAAAAARGRVFAICEADDEVAPGWLSAFASALQKHELVASPAETRKLNTPRVRRSRESSRGLQRSWFPPYLPHASTLGLGVRRDLFERVGGFDESFSAMQDADFCFRAQLVGAELVLVPEATVHYRFRTGFGDTYRQARRYAESYAQLQRKYKPPGTRVPGQWKWPLKNWRPIFRAIAGGGRQRLAWALGWQAGRIRGSVKHRVLAV